MKVYLDSVGCRLNQSEIEQFALDFRQARHTLVPTPAEAELVVLNTCSVTEKASSDSRKKIHWAGRHAPHNIIVTGCWATLNPQEAKALPGVQRVVANVDKDQLVTKVLGIPNFDREPIAREPTPGLRHRTRAFIKVQDGCDLRCTFCVTTLARGESRSRTVESILHDVRSALLGGANEVVLTGVHLGSWGRDFSDPKDLAFLVRWLLRETEIPRLRLSSLEPWDISEEFFSLWENPRLCRHLHLPLQSGSTTILRRMARRTQPISFAYLIETARSSIPEVAITTDIIVGFPGEGEVEFQESLDFVRQMHFSGGHVFTYSERSGTTAAEMQASVPIPTRKDRNAEMRKVLEETSSRYKSRFKEKILAVLWENATSVGPQGWEWSGLTDNYLRVFAHGGPDLGNTFSKVLLGPLREKGISGEILS